MPRLCRTSGKMLCPTAMSLLPSESPLQQSSTVRLVFWYGRPLFSLPDRSLCDLYIDDSYYRPADVES